MEGLFTKVSANPALKNIFATVGGVLREASERVSLAVSDIACAIESTGIVGSDPIQSRRRAEELTERAVRALDAGDAPRARAFLTSAILSFEFSPALVALRLLRLSTPRAVSPNDPGLSELLRRAREAPARDECRAFVETCLMSKCGHEGLFVAGAWLDSVLGDPKAAFSAYEKIADDHAGAACNLAVMLERGRGCEADGKRALELYQRAAGAGCSMAQCNLGACYEDGALGLEMDLESAVRLNEKAAAAGCAPAMLALAVIVAGDRAKRLLEDASQQGDAQAQVALAISLRECGEYPRALELLREASSRGGNASALYQLGVCHQKGLGVKKDDVTAAKLYRRAADRCDALAAVALASMLQSGTGVDRDDAEAAQLLQKAADSGDAEAQCNLGACYSEGRGVERNEERAAELWSRAAEQGHAGAQCCLGGLLLSGAGGVQKDETRAAELFRNAAAQGVASAQCSLAFMLESGTGVEKNESEALALYKQAAAAGFEEARQALERIKLQSL